MTSTGRSSTSSPANDATRPPPVGSSPTHCLATIPDAGLRAATASPMALAATTAALERAGLAHRDGDALTTHTLVRAAVRTHTTPEQAAELVDGLGRMLHAALPADVTTTPDAWPPWRELLPHAQAVLEATDPAADTPHTAWLAEHTAAYLTEQGHPEQAEPLAARAVTARERLDGPDHPDTLTARETHLRAALGADHLDHADGAVPGIVDEHVDPAESSGRGVERRLDLGLVGHVEWEGQDPTVGRGDQVVEGLGAAGGRHDEVAAAQRGLRDLTPEAGRRAGDEPHAPGRARPAGVRSRHRPDHRNGRLILEARISHALGTPLAAVPRLVSAVVWLTPRRQPPTAVGNSPVTLVRCWPVRLSTANDSM
ncbi:hypothetical protein FRACA_590005 [Frankia canadensis]|uniref:Tetratricopeptide repeat protein n=1 Tax=Frankia canadensis TaxID=1836972 RepID=A0A2I2KZ94_9ACTN|nr:hypothetical protein FRACA_590005 [Frankia canadensis]SOU58273.1 hypothetical protein FRACA_590005 [Frankia canadensis]